MTDAPPPDEDLRRWFRAMDLEHPAIRVLWRLALLQKRRIEEEKRRAS
jgi:hypothetical protein